MKYLLSTSCLALLAAFDNTAGWKMDGDKLALKDGNPIFINSAGVEQTVGGDTITKLNGEAKQHREAKEAAEASLEKFKVFDGIDPVKAKEALEIVGKLDKKKLIDAGEVDKVKDEIKASFTGQLEAEKALNGTLQSRINDMLVGDVFKGSEFVRDGVAVPRDMFEATFKSNFKVEDGKVTAYDKSGNKLMSKDRAGEYATPDEALRILVDAHPQKDVILKANAGNGSGNQGGGGAKGGSRSLARSEFEKLSPLQQSETSKKVAAGEMVLTD